MKQGIACLWLLMAAAPAAWAQSACKPPQVTHLRVQGEQVDEDDGHVIAGLAEWNVDARDAKPDETFTLGMAFSHASDDPFPSGGTPDLYSVEKYIVLNGLQFRGQIRQGERRYPAVDARVEVDGQPFASELGVQHGADNRIIAVTWQSWFSEQSLVRAMELGRTATLILLDAGGRELERRDFDVSALRGVRHRVLPYWRCTAGK